TEPAEDYGGDSRIPLVEDDGSYPGVRIGNPGNYTPVISYEVIEEEEEEEPGSPFTMDAGRVFFYGCILAALIASTLAGLAAYRTLSGVHLRLHAPSNAGQLGHWEPYTGQAFALLAVGAAVALLVAILRSR